MAMFPYAYATLEVDDWNHQTSRDLMSRGISMGGETHAITLVSYPIVQTVLERDHENSLI